MNPQPKRFMQKEVNSQKIWILQSVSGEKIPWNARHKQQQELQEKL